MKSGLVEGPQLPQVRDAFCELPLPSSSQGAAVEALQRHTACSGILQLHQSCLEITALIILPTPKLVTDLLNDLKSCGERKHAVREMWAWPAIAMTLRCTSRVNFWLCGHC